MSTTGRAPALAMPAAKATAWLSQMPTSKNWPGNVSRIFWSLFPSHMAAVITATLGSRRQASNRTVADGVGVGPARRGLERDDPVARLLKRGGGVELDRVFHRRLEAVPLVGQDVEQDRPIHRLDPLEVAAQGLEVVAVDRPQVDEPQLLEEHPVVQRGLDRVLELLEPALGVLADQGNIGQERFDPLVPVVVGARHPGAVEVIGQAADPRADRHLVVVEDDQQLLLQPAGVVERLEDDARGQGAVADDGDGVPVGGPDELVADLEPQGRGGSTAGVAGHEQVERAFGRVGVTHQAPLGPDRVQPVGAAGDQLVGIDLVARVPDQAVAGEVEGQMQGQAELDDAQVAGEVSRAAADHVDQLGCASRRRAARARLPIRSLRSAGDWILPSTESGWFINDPFPKEPAPGLSSGRRAGRSGSSAATASSANCRARRRLPSTPRNLGYVHLPSSESLPTRLPSLVSSP